MTARLLLFFILFLPSISFSQDTLPPVVVTATRTETPQRDVAASISVVTAEDIRAQEADTVLEVLRGVPGLDVVQSGSRGALTSVFIRGSESEHILVLIDGVEVNSTTLGAFNFAHMTTENIDRIEILRGAGGTLYGSQAIGGVINIITKKGEGSPQFTASAAGGNGRTHQQVLALTGGTGPLGYSLSVSRLETEGFRRFDMMGRRFNDDYRNLSTSARLDYRFVDDARVTGIFHLIKTDLGLFNSNNFIPLPDPNAREALSQYLGKIEWEQKILQGWDYRISGSIFKEHIKDSDDPEAGSFDARERARFRPQISTAEFQTNYRLGEWSTTTFGLEFKRRKASTSSSSSGSDLGGINRAVRNIGYYLQEQIRLFGDRLILIPGVRLDDHQTFGVEWSPSFSTAYLLKETGTKLKAGYAEGFRAPTLNELFFPPAFGCPAFGNPSLGPERSWELNAGVEQELFDGRLRLGPTYFHREVKDLIEATPISAFCSRAENVGRARFDGVEWFVKLQILSNLSLAANYTFLDWDTADGKLIRRPRHRGNFNLDYHYQAFRVNLDAIIVGQRDDRKATNFNQFVTQPGYVRFDLAGSYQIPIQIHLVRSLSLFGKIENLFNKKYEEADGFRARPLNFLLGIRGTFGSK
jgi:vitamin B12 transporter